MSAYNAIATTANSKFGLLNRFDSTVNVSVSQVKEANLVTALSVNPVIYNQVDILKSSTRAI
jgi:hypothetical protein